MNFGKFRLSGMFAAVWMSVACSSGSSESGILIEGTLIQGSASSHARISDARLAHSAGQPIENVYVCGLGECSRTDLDGVWGFVAPEEFRGGIVEISIDGHGLLDTAQITVPAGISEVMVELVNIGGDVVPETVWADGQRVGPNDPSHAEHSHAGHSHGADN